MRFEGKTKIEKAWLVAAVSIFVTYRLLESSSPDYYPSSPLRLFLELAMIALSFPFGGLTLFALHGAAFWCDDCRKLEFLFDWPTLLFAGYIQWFWVLPEFLRSRKLSLPGLTRSLDVAAPSASPSVKELATQAPHDATPPHNTAPAAIPAAPLKAATPRAIEAAPRPAFAVAAYAPALAEFDEEGLTALDRVFQAQAPSPAPGRPSHVEAIFPRVS